MLFIKLARKRIPLKCPETKSVMLAHGDFQKRCPKSTPLAIWQHIEMVDPAFAKGYESNKLSVLEIARSVTAAEHAFPEEPLILFWRVSNCDPRKRVIARSTMNHSRAIHVAKLEGPQHFILPSFRRYGDLYAEADPMSAQVKKRTGLADSRCPQRCCWQESNQPPLERIGSHSAKEGPGSPRVGRGGRKVFKDGRLEFASILSAIANSRGR
jgi:hypothetical protein